MIRKFFSPLWPTNRNDPASDRWHGDFGRFSDQCSAALDSSVSGIWVDLDSIPYSVIHIPPARCIHLLDGASLSTVDEAPVDPGCYCSLRCTTPILSSRPLSRRANRRDAHGPCSGPPSSTASLPPSCARTLFGDIGGCQRCGSLDLRWRLFL